MSEAEMTREEAARWLAIVTWSLLLISITHSCTKSHYQDAAVYYEAAHWDRKTADFKWNNERSEKP